MNSPEKHPIAMAIVYSLTGIVFISILAGFAYTRYKEYIFEQEMTDRFQQMTDANSLAEASMWADSNLDYLEEINRLHGSSAPAFKNHDEDDWVWWKNLQDLTGNDLTGDHDDVDKAFRLTQKIAGRSFQNSLDNPEAGTARMMELKKEFIVTDFAECDIECGLTIRHKMQNLTDTRPVYTRMVPRAILFNSIMMMLLVAPLMLLWVVLYFGFEIHEEINPKKIVASLKQLFNNDPEN